MGNSKYRTIDGAPRLKPVEAIAIGSGLSLITMLRSIGLTWQTLINMANLTYHNNLLSLDTNQKQLTGFCLNDVSYLSKISGRIFEVLQPFKGL